MPTSSKDGKLVQVDPDDVTVGGIIVVQPAKVPLDGVVTGSSTLNTAALTGESLPVMPPPRRRGHQRLRRYDGRAEDPHHRPSVNLPSQILELVENSSSPQIHSKNFISNLPASHPH